MTSLRKRLENVLAELENIKNALAILSSNPPCCWTLSEEGLISCDYLGPLPKEDFLKECEKCRAEIERIVKNLVAAKAAFFI
jgi:hypothetical protein